MPIVGETAPEFDSEIHSGGRLSLAQLKGAPVVLYFYPEADTPGCTVESKGFRDAYPDFKKEKVEIVGVSVDSVKAQCDFAEKYSLPFPLVADHTKAVSKLYGVLGPGGRARRVSFFIGADQKIIDVVQSRDAKDHVAKARQAFLKGKA
ncbi:MAG: peroxiredoxin [Thermoplasmata archaeon]|nr:peroxiredoxin [Thermoplasmata archaeon]